jgi:3-oxoacyl-[acyl-carrier protein] reductase
MAEGAARLAGKVAIVTGAGGGFGEGIARRYAAEGARVAVLDIRGGEAERVAGAIGGLAIEADVGERSSVDAAVRAIVDQWGAPDIVVNNAGITHRNRPLLEVDEETFDRVFRVNVKSLYLMTMATVPLMREKGGGSIINIGSTAGLRPRPGLSWYNASKGAVNTLSKSLAVELAPDNIRVNAICPVMGETGLLEAFMGKPDTPENRAAFVATIPLGRMSRPEDIAQACVWLASDEAAFVTGILLPVDGGRTI